MESVQGNKVKIQASVNANVEKVWKLWNAPEHITQWNSASPEWHTPKAENDLREGGQFTFRMEAKDGSYGFDFGGTYDKVIPNKAISYALEDGRRVDISFEDKGGGTEITEVFDAESENSVEMQRAGWQAILDNFKKYAESVDA
jgi:uncharacterized protein YndB with AHSA1/START domain